jgi:hypothetical protein
MWLNLHAGGVGNSLYPYGLELADWKLSLGACQPHAVQSAGLNDDGIGRDGAQ